MNTLYTDYNADYKNNNNMDECNNIKYVLS